MSNDFFAPYDTCIECGEEFLVNPIRRETMCPTCRSIASERVDALKEDYRDRTA